PAQALAALADRYYEAQARLDPLYATLAGDNRFDDGLAVTIAPAHRRQRFAMYRQGQHDLNAIDTSQLTPTDNPPPHPLPHQAPPPPTPARQRARHAPGLRALPRPPPAAGAARRRPAGARQLRRRAGRAAAQDGAAIRRVPQAHRATAGVDRPGHRQHARGHE